MVAKHLVADAATVAANQPVVAKHRPAVAANQPVAAKHLLADATMVATADAEAAVASNVVDC